MPKNFSAILLVLLLSLSGCSFEIIVPTPTLQATSISPTQNATKTPEAAAFADPFTYCGAVGRMDVPDSRYTGDPVPDEIINGFKKAAGLETSSMPSDMFKKSTIWRCMDGKVYACNYGANLPCASKADTSAVPTQKMNEFCKANPNAEFLPMSETGHDTIYSWRCAGETAEVAEQISEVDGAGYIANIWYLIEPNP